MVKIKLTARECEDRSYGWTAAVVRVCEHGVPVLVEGVLWQEAEAEHGFWGAVSRVREAHRRRRG